MNKQNIIKKVIAKLKAKKEILEWRNLIQEEAWVVGKKIIPVKEMGGHRIVASKQLIDFKILKKVLEEYSKEYPLDKYIQKIQELITHYHDIESMQKSEIDDLTWSLKNAPGEMGEKVCGKEIFQDMTVLGPDYAFSKHTGAVADIGGLSYGAWKFSDKSIKNLQDYFFKKKIPPNKELKIEIHIEEWSSKKNAKVNLEEFLNVNSVSNLWRN
jgi:hypothetical protein